MNPRVAQINQLFANSPTGSQGYVAAPSATRTLNAVYNAPQTQNVQQDNPDYQSWGNNILQMLQQAQQQGQQQLGTTQMEQVQRSTAPLPGDLSGMRLSPQDILGFRRGEGAALEPTIGGIRSQISEAGQQITNVKDFIKQ